MEKQNEESPWTYQPKACVLKPAPEIVATAYHEYDFKEIKLSDYKGKYVVLFFWPLDFTFVCPTEIIAFSDMAKTFRENGAEIIGCSVDSQFTHMEYCMKPRKNGGLGDMDIPMIADLSKQIAKDYGSLVDHGKHNGCALRATYIIDKEGIIRHISQNDLPVGRNTDEILRLVQAFQYTDEHGEVCPAKWKPGKKAIIPDKSNDKTVKYWEEIHENGGEK